jgi:hemolysin activation/secretion protein
MQRDPRIRRLEAQLVPGPRRGEADLDLRVFEERPYRAELEYSNHESPAVGSQRVRLKLSHLNLTGNADSLQASYAATSGLGEVEVTYELPINRRDTRLGIRYMATRTQAVEDPFDDLDIESRTATYALDFRHPLLRDMTKELSLFGSAEYRRSRSYLLGSGFPFSKGTEDDGLSKISVLRFGQSFIYRDRQQVVAARSTLSWGLDALGATRSGSDPDGQFLAWLGQFQWARRFRPLSASMLLRTDVQLAFDPLLPLEQFAIGGHASVRGYRENLLVRDSGLVVSLEFRIPVWRRASGASLLELAPFYDFGKSWNHSRSTPSLQSISGVGVGLIAPINRRTRAEIYWAADLRNTPDASEEHDPQDSGIHFRVRTAF